MGDNLDIVKTISSFLDSGNYKDALNVLKDDKRKERFSDYCWEVVSTALCKIEDDTIVIKPSLHNTCEQILSLIQEKCDAEDAFLEFIERLERAKNDAQFGIVLPIIQQLLERMSTKPLNKKRSLEWCMYSITNYIDKIKLSEHALEGEERKLIDSDPNVRRVIKVYTMVIPFYQPFLNYAVANERHTKINAKQIIVDFLICLMGKPLIYIDIDLNSNAKSEARQACQTIIQDLCKLERNVYKLLPILVKKEKQRLRYTDGSDKVAAMEHSERMNMTNYAGYFYVTCSGHFEIPDSAIPQVYSNEYIIHSLLLAVNHLLKYSEYGPISKALALYQAVNNRFSPNTSHEILSSSIHYDLLNRLVQIAIYCNYQKLRKTAVDCIESHINKFNYKGRCALINYLIGSSNHSGMIGFAITLYKKALIESFNEPVLNECFSGVQLNAMIKKICSLPHGAESDLMELADQIMTALNFLIFMILKDKDNITGIRDMIPTIETEYLEVLMTALKMSKAHYELKLKDINNDEEPVVSLTVVGNVLDSIPVEKKKEIIQSALNAFHLMEGLVARVNECIKLISASD